LSSKHREIAEVSRGEEATGFPVGIPVAANRIEALHQQQGTTHLRVGMAHAAQIQQKKNLQEHTTTHQQVEIACMKENEGMQQRKPHHLTVNGSKYTRITSK